MKPFPILWRRACRYTGLALTVTATIWFMPQAEASADRDCQSPIGMPMAIAVGGHETYRGSVVGKSAAEIPVWKTITLGAHETVDSLREALKKARCRIGDLAGAALDLGAFTIGKEEAEINLTVLSVGELGFAAEGATLAEIYSRARQIGLELCPAEVAPQLRLQYLDQRLGEFLQIAMEPLATRNGDTVGFTVGNGGAGLFLIGGDARPERIVPSTVRFVFVRPGSSQSRHGS